MFENFLHQNAKHLLVSDMKNGTLPQSLLFVGDANTGKLTCALELARVLSCTGKSTTGSRGDWDCDCPRCALNKELSNPNVVLCGPRECSLEIDACKDTFLRALYNGSSFLKATQYLFIRSVRKLTMRFSEILWEGDEKLSKIANLTQKIDENLELIAVKKNLPENDEVSKIANEISETCKKLESDFLYGALPINQIRNISNWSRLTTSGGKKVVIFENADKMLEAGRNALLKILEEPPSDVVFIMTATQKGSVMPTILSRVRPYIFNTRKASDERDIIERVFHPPFNFDLSGNENLIEKYLLNFLSVKPETITTEATTFLDAIKNRQYPNISETVKKCATFEPRMLLKLFLFVLINIEKTADSSSSFGNSALNAEKEFKMLKVVKDCWNNVSVFNQSPAAALEVLVRDFASIFKTYGASSRL